MTDANGEAAVSKTETDPEVAGTTIPLHDFLDLGFTWQDGPGVAEVRMPVRPAALGFTRNLHGGAIATMVDLACALAAAQTSGHDPKADSLITIDPWKTNWPTSDLRVDLSYAGNSSQPVAVLAKRAIRAVPLPQS